MKHNRFETVFGVVLAIIFGGIVVHAPLSVGLGVLFPHYDLLIKSWKEILMLVLIPMAVVIITRRHVWAELTRDWVLRLVAAYGLLHLVMAAVLHRGATATLAGLAIDLRYVLFFALVYLLIKVRPDYRLRMLVIGALGAMVVVVFGTLQLFLPADILSHIGYSSHTIAPYLTVDKNAHYIRINSTLRGPNPLGAYAVIVLALMTSLLTRAGSRLKTPVRRIGFGLIALCSLIVLWISYSRSAVIAGLAAIAIVVALTIGRRLSARWWIISCVVICASLGGLLAVKGSTFVSNVILHENPNGGSSVSSNQGHISSLESGGAQLIHQPLGAGIGSTGSASLYGASSMIIENQYLFIAHEAGWLGLILYMWLFILILIRLGRQRRDWLSLGVFASGIGLGLIGLLLPVWVDDTVSIVWWGLAAIALGERRV